MIERTRDELERRLEQARRLSKAVYDPTSKARIDKLKNDLELQQKHDDEK